MNNNFKTQCSLSFLELLEYFKTIYPELYERLKSLIAARNSLAYYLSKLTNDYIIGFLEGDGCFSYHSSKHRQPIFIISQHAADYFLFKAIVLKLLNLGTKDIELDK